MRIRALFPDRAYGGIVNRILRYVGVATVVAALVVLVSFNTGAGAAKPQPIAASIGLAAGSDARFGGIVSFDTTVPKLTGTEHPLIYVECAQAGTRVYGELHGPDLPFTLGGSSSLWIENGGGPASCFADLDGYSKQCGGFCERLASTTFEATG